MEEFPTDKLLPSAPRMDTAEPWTGECGASILALWVRFHNVIARKGPCLVWCADEPWLAIIVVDVDRDTGSEGYGESTQKVVQRRSDNVTQAR
jgi:hypothetical protein